MAMARFRQRVDRATSRLHSKSAFDQLGGFIVRLDITAETLRTSERCRHHHRLERAYAERTTAMALCLLPNSDRRGTAPRGKIMNRDLRNVLRSPDQSWDGKWAHESESVDIFPVGDTMSRPMADTPKRRARRQFTDEFKAGVVRLVLDEGKTVAPSLATWI